MEMNMDECIATLIEALRIGFHLGNHCPSETFEDYLMGVVRRGRTAGISIVGNMFELISEAAKHEEVECALDSDKRDALHRGLGAAIALNAVNQSENSDDPSAIAAMADRYTLDYLRRSIQARLDTLAVLEAAA